MRLQSTSSRCSGCLIAAAAVTCWTCLGDARNHSNLKIKQVQRLTEALGGDAGAVPSAAGWAGERRPTVSMEGRLELCKVIWFPGGAFMLKSIGAFQWRPLIPWKNSNN
jgi:hypothetical protein